LETTHEVAVIEVVEASEGVEVVVVAVADEVR
jgi:hypothetical protein